MYTPNAIFNEIFLRFVFRLTSNVLENAFYAAYNCNFIYELDLCMHEMNAENLLRCVDDEWILVEEGI